MSISSKAVLMVGLPREDFESEDYIDNEYLTFCPPSYDSADGIVGIIVESANEDDFKEVLSIADLDKKLKKEALKFKNLTGLDAKIYITQKWW